MSEAKDVKRWIGSLALLLAGALLGGVVVAVSRGTGSAGAPPTAPGSREDVRAWTCSMHPQVRMERPGKCPICGMELVPVVPDARATDGASAGAAGLRDHLALSEHARAMARVETAAVEERPLVKEIRTVGKVALDETAVAYITARVDGRVDEVFASFPGTRVGEGDHLASVYSPDLLTTQEELFIAARQDADQARAGHPPTGATAAARRRLELWGITDAQIDEIAKGGKAHTHLVVYAPRGGTVIEKSIRAGQYVKTGDQLFTVADLSRVWLVVDVYESELSWVRFGQPVEVTLDGAPGRVFPGAVGFVEPVLNEPTRTVRVRVMLRNDAGTFKPGMFAQALIRVPVMPGGSPGPTGLEGKYACPMHPYIVSAAPRSCSVCGMKLALVPRPEGDAALAVTTTAAVLAVPAEAVLTTGRRSLVYVEEAPGEYRLVEPRLGPRAGDWFPVLAGLEAGARVVTRGNFLLDSQFQIGGKPSLLYPEGIRGGGAGHSGHAMPPGASMPPPADRKTEGSPGSAPATNPHAGHGGM